MSTPEPPAGAGPGGSGFPERPTPFVPPDRQAPPGPVPPGGGYPIWADNAVPPGAVPPGAVPPAGAFMPVGPGRPKRSKRRIAVGVSLAVLGLAAVAGGAVPIGWHLVREPTRAEIEAAGEKEIAARWRTLTAAQIFPAKVSTPGKDGYGKRVSPAFGATRVGIAPAAACEETFDAPLARILVKHGCRTVLRATYVDDSGTLAATIGVAVMPSRARANSAEADAGAGLGAHVVKERYGVRVAEFPGTAAAGFRDSLRRDFWLDTNGTPYMVFRSSGWLVSRGRPAQEQVMERFYFAQSVSSAIRRTLGPQDQPCRTKGVRC
jgi:hypothetical protein